VSIDGSGRSALCGAGRGQGVGLSGSRPGVALTGPGGLLKALTKTVLETALEEEMAEHLGYDKHGPVGRNRSNSCNGKRAKTVLTDSGEVAIEVPRDRDGSFEPVIVAKRLDTSGGVGKRADSGHISQVAFRYHARGLVAGGFGSCLPMGGVRFRLTLDREPRRGSPQILVNEVSVKVHCHGRRCMPKHPLQDLRVRARAKHTDAAVCRRS
jgi:Transposase, Mutator family